MLISRPELIEELLDISRIVTGKVRLRLRRVTVAPIVAAAVDSLRPSAEAKDSASGTFPSRQLRGPRRPATAAADRLESRVERHQVHAPSRSYRRRTVQEMTATSTCRCATRASASRPNSSPMCSSASVRRTVPPLVPIAASALVCRSCVTLWNCTGPPSRPPATD